MGDASRLCFMSVIPAPICCSGRVSDYVAGNPSCCDLIRSGLIDPVLEGRFNRIDDPKSALLDLLARIDRNFDAIYVASSTCAWPVEEAVDLSDRLGERIFRGGCVRFLTGKGCNTVTDASALASGEIARGDAAEILVLYVEACGSGFNRLQNYAFFSDQCIAIHFSASGGTHEVLSLRNGLAPYSGSAFSASNDLTSEGIGKIDSLLMLNCFDFVLRFKYGRAALFEYLHEPSFPLHHFGADPFLTIAAGEAPGRVLLHVESPPRHVSQLLLRQMP